ncbi:hypothetical protein C8R43DRAFT_1125993 [Mycena crocata]|nr:hypothetical protein C8R43DRAFT_1125993 [Mycena crocata]
MASSSETPANSLGLDFDQLKIQDPPEAPSKPEEAPQSPSPDAAKPAEKAKPYVRVPNTGGSQRDKLSEEALSERMARMREQNEKIKQRRLDVQADEEAFKKTQETERVKLAQSRKVQEGVDRTREQNAKRKLDKMQSREWDSGKPAGGDWKQRQAPKSPDASQPQKADPLVDEKEETTSTPTSPPSAHDSGGWTRGASSRGSPRARGRGRGRGRGGSTGGPDKSDASPAPTVPDVAPSAASVPKVES